MAYSAKTGSFNIDTTKTAGQTQAISGLGFQPKIVMFWWSSSVATGDSVAGGNICYGFGAGINSTTQFYISQASTDAAATSASLRAYGTDACIVVFPAGSGAFDGGVSFSSLDADGFTLQITDQFTNAYRISYLALGGTDLSNVKIGQGTMATSAGNYNVTGVGFQPDALIASTYFFTSATAGTNNYFSLGWATSSSAQGVISSQVDNGVGTSNTLGYGYNGEIIGTRAGSHREAFVEFIADGFTMNHLEGASAYLYSYIALKGGQYSVGDLTTRTDGNDIAETTGFQPVAILFGSANRALSTQDTATDHARLSIGAGTSTTNRAVQAISDEDNLADTETAFANYDSAVYAHVVDDAIAGLMDIKSIDASGFTCVMDDTDPSANWVTYLAIGAASTGRTATLSKTLDNVTLSSSAKVATDSDLSKTLGSVTNSSNGLVANESDLSKTLGTASLSSSSINSNLANASKTLDGVSEASSGLASNYTDLSTTLESIENVSNGTGAIGSSSDNDLSDGVFSSDVDIAIVGNSNSTLENTTLSSSGIVGTSTITANLNVTLDNIENVSNATNAIGGSSGETLGTDTFDAEADVSIYGNSSISLADTLFASAGIIGLHSTGTLDVVLAAVTLIATGIVTPLPVSTFLPKWKYDVPYYDRHFDVSEYNRTNVIEKDRTFKLEDTEG